VAERLVGQSFAPLDVSAPNRVGATATTLATGDVLILGGAGDDGKALASGLVLGLGALPPTVTALPSALSSPRAGHTTTVVGKDLLVCGGVDNKGAPLATCDLLDGTTLAIKKTLMLGTARTQHSAAVLETGPIVIAGGLGADGMPLTAMEIYTP
jgi:hypothetical protein